MNARLPFGALAALLCALPLAGQMPTHLPLRSMMPARSVPTGAVTAGDLDEDGDLDLALAEELNGVQVALWSDAGGFQELAGAIPSYAADGGDYQADLGVGDLDGDGDLDLALVEGTGPSPLKITHTWANHGDGTFVETGWFSGYDTKNSALVLVDLNVDGFLDAVAAGDKATAWVHTAAGGYITKDIPAGIYATADIAAGDVNADGKPDVVFSNPSASTQLLLNTGLALVYSEEVFSGQPSSRVAMDDLDGDGALDVVLADAGPPGWLHDTVHHGAGDGTFGPPSLELPPYEVMTFDLLLADLDGDLDPDLVATGDVQSGSASTRVFENLGLGSWGDRTADQSLKPDTVYAAEAGDFDGDGDADVVLANHGANRLALNGGDLDLHDGVETMYWRRAALGDLDGDEDLDLVTVYSSLGWSVFDNRGGGLFADVSADQPKPLEGAFTRDVVLGDIDADGDLDALIADSAHPPVILRGAGDLTFTYSLADTAPAHGSPHAVGLADVDADGDLDGVVGGYGPDTLYRNPGSGVLLTTETIDPDTVELTSRIAVGDVDLDGDTDLFRTFDATDYAPRWATNDGTGAFTSTLLMPVPLHYPTDAAIPDSDMDGDLDVFAVRVTAWDFRNDGPLGFTDASPALPQPGVDTIAAADFDDDGDVDVAGGTESIGKPCTSLLRNHGGVFSDDSDSFAITGVYGVDALVAGDVDGDGDADVLASYYGNTPVLTNLLRQVARRRVASLGQPLALDVFGPPGTPWFLAFSPGTTVITLPPLGTLYLDPAGLVLLGSGLLDGAGRGSVAGELPATPTLAGATLYAQGLVGSPLEFTNLEPLELLDL